MKIIELTKNEKKLLEAIIETWQQEGCPNIHPWIWGRDERDPNDRVMPEDDKVGEQVIEEAIEDIKKKLNIKIY